jgi:hypothetical protein
MTTGWRGAFVASCAVVAIALLFWVGSTLEKRDRLGNTIAGILGILVLGLMALIALFIPCPSLNPFCP